MVSKLPYVLRVAVREHAAAAVPAKSVQVGPVPQGVGAHVENADRGRVAGVLTRDAWLAWQPVVQIGCRESFGGSRIADSQRTAQRG